MRSDDISVLFRDRRSTLCIHPIILTVEESFNRQNDRVYAKSRSAIPEKYRNVIRSHHPGYVMVWIGFSYYGKTQLHFVKPGVKVRYQNYLDDILEPIIRPLSQTMFNGLSWTLQ